MELDKDTVSLWRKRFLTAGVAGLQDRPRAGAPRKHGPELREHILARLELPPPEGFGHWDGPLLATTLEVPAWRVWEILCPEGICLARRRSWCASQDPNFAAKAADVVALYLCPPENAIVFSVDEKPSIQAITRPAVFVRAGKKVVQGDKSTYKRNCTTTLFAALDLATGKVIAKTRTSPIKHKPEAGIYYENNSCLCRRIMRKALFLLVIPILRRRKITGRYPAFRGARLGKCLGAASHYASQALKRLKRHFFRNSAVCSGSASTVCMAF